MAKSIRCNMCGKVFDIWDAQENFSIERLLGYGTKYDGDALQLNLCCDCMDDIISRCAVSPIKDQEMRCTDKVVDFRIGGTTYQ